MIRTRPNRFACLLLTLSFSGPLAFGASLVVTSANFNGLDIDGDLQPEIVGIGAFAFTNAVSTAAFPPRSATGAFGVHRYGSLNEMWASSIASTDVHLIMESSGDPMLASDTAFDETTPILAFLGWGTRYPGAEEGDPHYLIGWVLDATDYLADQSQPLRIYYHNYGGIIEGETRTLSLEDTGAPIPEASIFLLLALSSASVLLRRRRSNPQV